MKKWDPKYEYYDFDDDIGKIFLPQKLLKIPSFPFKRQIK